MKSWMVAPCGVGMLVLTACGASLQTTAPVLETPEKRLTIGTVQQEIRKGMSAAAVTEALGAPNIITTDEERREVWIYDRVTSERVREWGYAGLILVGSSRETGAVSQRTLTVIVKFDVNRRVRDYAYHASRF